ncbi:MAG: hypothetical protein D6753_02585 [Planctomycetota bacterium]|nr:MAG: hypothetical protein D6753_02585 [Planctomycetota bacterium]
MTPRGGKFEETAWKGGGTQKGLPGKAAVRGGRECLECCRLDAVGQGLSDVPQTRLVWPLCGVSTFFAWGEMAGYHLGLAFAIPW